MDRNDSCGGPSPFKAFSDHLNRDQSLHQGGIRNNAGASSAGTFRSTNQSGNQGQQAFDQHMNAAPQLPVEHATARLQDHSAALQGPMSHEPPQSYQGPMPQSFSQSYPSIHHQQSGQANHHAPTNNAGNANWVAEFQAFNGRQNAQAAQSAPRTMPAQQQMMSHQQHSHMQGPHYQPAHFAGSHFAQAPHFAGLSDPFVSVPRPQQVTSPAQQQGQNASIYAPLYDPANRHTDPTTGAMIREGANDDFDDEMNAWLSENGTTGYMAAVDQELASVAQEFAQHSPPTEANIDSEAIVTEVVDELDGAARAAQAAATRRAAGIAELRQQLDLESPLEQLSLTDLARQELASLSQAPAAEQTSAATSTAAAEDARAASDLSEVAGRLLNSVGHETGDKWANSQFLQLMRDFRDGTKTIVDGTLQGGDEPDFNDALKGKGPAPGPGDDNAPEGSTAGAV